MRILNQKQATSQYQQLKQTIKDKADHPGSGVVRQGDRFEVTRSFEVKTDLGALMVRARSAVDDDLSTKDTINAVKTEDGVRSNLSFLNFSQKKGWLFKRDQEMLTVTQSETSPSGFSNVSRTFEV